MVVSGRRRQVFGGSLAGRQGDRRSDRRSHRRSDRRRDGRSGQQHTEDTAAPGNTAHAQYSPVRADNAGGRGKAESAAGELGGEEGIENALPGIGRHAAAVVLHLDGNVVAGGQFLIEVLRLQPRRIHAHRFGNHPDHTGPVADGFGAVDHQIHEQLLELDKVAFDGGQSRRQFEIQFHVARDG